MKSYKYSNKERAERVAKELGCSGHHYHNESGKRKYMPCKSHEIFKTKIKKQSDTKEEEVTELVDADGTWETSAIPILDPAVSVKGSTFTDKIVPMSRNPRDPLLRGWYGYYGEGEIKEEDMADAFGFEDTMYMDYKETVNYYQKKLGLDRESAKDRAIQQGKKPNLNKRTPKRIKQLKNFIDRLILKEKGIDEGKDIIEDKLIDDKQKNKGEILDDTTIIKKNIKSLLRMSKKHGMSVNQLIDLIKNEQ